MTALQDALAALVAATATVDGLAGLLGDSPGAIASSLPCCAVGAPTPRWETYCAAPTSATFPLTLLVRLDDLAIETLLSYLEAVQAAVETLTPATILSGLPVSYDLGGGISAAGYELTVEYPLSG